MFDFLKNKKNDTVEILSVMSGEVKTIDNTPDEVFSQKMIGDGYVVFPSSGKVYAPVSGTISQIAHTFHAVTITTDDNQTILIHIGLDTVKLNGEGFTCHVKVSDRVEASDLIMEVDLDLLKEKELNSASPCIVLSDDPIAISVKTGSAEGGKTVALTLEK